MNEFVKIIKEYLTPETVTTITAVLMFLVSSLKMISTIKTLSKQKSTTIDDVMSALKSQNKEEIENAINDVVTPIVNTVNEINPYLQTFAKILALSQENTATSRLAILELIEKMGTVDGDTLADAKESVQTEVKNEQEKKQETLAKLESIENKPVE